MHYKDGGAIIMGMHLAIRNYMFMSPFLEEMFRGDYFEQNEQGVDKDEYTNSRRFMEHMLWQTPLDSRIRVMKETVKVLALRKLIFFF